MMTRVSANFNWSIHGFLYHKLKADQNLLCIAMSIIRQVPRRSNLWALRNPSGHWNIRSVWVLGSQHHNSSDKAWPRTLGSARILRYIFFENNFWGFLKKKWMPCVRLISLWKMGSPLRPESAHKWMRLAELNKVQTEICFWFNFRSEMLIWSWKSEKSKHFDV